MADALSYLDALKYILPEVALTIGLCAVLIWDLLGGGADRPREGAWLSLGFLGLTCLLLIQRLGWQEATVFGMVRVDPLATVFKLFIATAVGLVIAFDLADRRQPAEGKGETWFLLLTAALGGFFLVGTGNLILLYLGLETLGLSSYALAGIHKRDRAGAEASLKYVVYGALASGVLLFGASLLYGMSGTLEMREMARFLVFAVDEGRSAQVLLPTLLILVGFGFKLSLFPFQWWAPDVYQGVSTPIAAFLAVASKGAALAALVRLIAVAYSGLLRLGPDTFLPETDFTRGFVLLLALMSAATMLFGNLAALRQENLKRLLAYSSIGHAGYMLMGVAVLGEAGFRAALAYSFVYYLMTLGAFGMVLYFANQSGSEDIRGLHGMGPRHPLAATATIVFLASLTGLPPTAGFFGKWYLMVAAWEGGLPWLALLTALMSVVSLFYYFRIARALFLRPEEEATPLPDAPRTPVLGGILAVLAAGTLVFLWFEPLLAAASVGVEAVLHW
ncbi:MAG: NADH-quinone oxidoreductase subunit N [Planctomycetota bacterium]|nr:MAG: NADH-quinone oxidoreductase subunit N [Planctomycetota bacterium]